MKRVRATGGKPPVFKPTKIVKVGGVKRKFTGKGARGVGLGLGGKGKKITKKGYTGKGAYGYGQGKGGVKAPTRATGATAAAPKAARAGGGGTTLGGGKPPVKKPPKTRRSGVSPMRPPKAARRMRGK